MNCKFTFKQRVGIASIVISFLSVTGAGIATFATSSNTHAERHAHADAERNDLKKNMGHIREDTKYTRDRIDYIIHHMKKWLFQS